MFLNLLITSANDESIILVNGSVCFQEIGLQVNIKQVTIEETNNNKNWLETSRSDNEMTMFLTQ